MLRFLRIRNLAVIEAVDVEFESGFTVLTGETGAGKSILVEAVGLLLGGRASADLVRTGEPHATIEAIFEHDGRDVVVRRELTSQGRSRAFVDGALATAAILRDLSARLVELHGQHEHQTLLDPATHLPVLDGHAGLVAAAAGVAAEWDALRTLRERLERSRMDAREKAARLDLLAFQLGEIAAVAPVAGEDDALSATRQVLANAERVRRLCDESYAALYERDDAALAALAGVWRRVGELAAIDPGFAPFLEARDGIKGQLEELAYFLRSYGEGVDASPGRLQEVEDRLARLERIKRKYGPNLDDVIARARALEDERVFLGGAGEQAADLHRAVAHATERFLAAARDLSRRRRAAAPAFTRSLEALLADLAMPQCRFDVRFNEVEPGPHEWSAAGIDRAEFYLSPNPGEDLRPLARIASGGELSRVMLALKTLTVGEGDGRTLVFDEVDAGIGGRVADVVGARLRDLGRRFQVLCITHLPQIAARGGAHFRIEKHVRGSRTMTTVERLREAGRVDELARMLGGAVVTDPVRATARELLAGAANVPGDARGPAGPGDPRQAKGESESPTAGRKRKSSAPRPESR